MKKTMKKAKAFTTEEKDYIDEMMNIGAGNAATAFSQLLHHPVELIIPVVHVLPPISIPSIIGDPLQHVTSVRTKMIGDITGTVFFIMPEASTGALLRVMAERRPGSEMDLAGTDSPICEIANILVGVYMAAIHDFCKLNIYHTIPEMAADMLQAILDDYQDAIDASEGVSIVVENQFMIKGDKITGYLLIIPNKDSLSRLGGSMKNVRCRTNV
jgi:chemotaxis protein CheC